MKWNRFQIGKTISALGMACILTITSVPVRAETVQDDEQSEQTEQTEEQTTTSIQITDEQELLTFAKNCMLADYSENLEVYLENDLKLSKKVSVEFDGITSFSGVFYGQDHTISGLQLKSGSEAIGLFHYLEEGAVVKDLKVVGTIESTQRRNMVGGIVGINAGTIQNCSFKGVITGTGATGGIVGFNGPEGLVNQCKNYGVISGVHNVGGIAGLNHGVVSDSTNETSVNSDDSWLELEDDSELSLSVEGVLYTLEDDWQNGTDIGGIAGFSDGIIAGCVNNDTVGYPHSGRNVGGIVGRQNGEVIRSVNNGKVYGKQDVGGIVGQFEPKTKQEDVESIEKAVDELHDLMNQMIDDMEAFGDDVHKDLDDLNGGAANATDTADALLDEMREVVKKNVDVLNDLSSRVDYVIQHSSTVMTYVNQALQSTGEIIDDMDQLKKDLRIDGQEDLEDGENVDEAAQDAVDGVDRQSESLSSIVENVASIADKIHELLTDENGNPRNPEELTDEELNELVNYLSEMEEYLKDALETARSVLKDTNTIRRLIIPYLKDFGEQIKNDFDQLSEDVKSMNDALQNAGGELQSIVDYLDALHKLEAVDLSENFDKNADLLTEEMHTISDILKRMNTDLDVDSDVVQEDIRAINDQLNVVFDLMIQKINNLEDMTKGKNIMEDHSADGEGEDDAARISNSNNKGYVNGDRNVGGIAGNIAVDGTDISDEETTLGNKYITRAILQDCNNTGIVEVRNENAGGIAGKMDVGYLADCLGSGKVSGETGNYIGGIVGRSKGTIDRCSSMAVLSGGEYIGGIAGSADKISNSYSMASILEADGYIGAIAGMEENDDSEEDDPTIRRSDLRERIHDNYYVSSRLFGINGVSYVGVAEPITYEELVERPETNLAFRHMEAIFVDADDNVVKRENIKYGERLENLKYPVLQTEAGDYIEWEGLEGDVIEGNLVIKAVTTANVTILSSEEKAGNKSLALAEGIFTESAYISAEALDSSEVEALPADAPVGSECHVYRITLKSTGLADEDVTRLRLLNEEGRKAVIYRQTENNGWQKLDSKKAGSYTEVEMIGTENIFCIASYEKESNLWIVILVGGCIAVIVVLGAIIVKLKKEKREA